WTASICFCQAVGTEPAGTCPALESGAVQACLAWASAVRYAIDREERSVMGKTLHEDVSNAVLSRMKESGFDFARVHPIEFYAIFPSEERSEEHTSELQ